MRGLPRIVELLGLEEADNVVCGAAIALRNLALDRSNRTLIGILPAWSMMLCCEMQLFLMLNCFR